MCTTLSTKSLGFLHLVKHGNQLANIRSGNWFSLNNKSTFARAADGRYIDSRCELGISPIHKFSVILSGKLFKHFRFFFITLV